ncbi:MAG: ATP-dependent DNA ligase, partial [Actinomycetes bacterium]
MVDEVVVEADGHDVVISHPEKVFFSERGQTKLDLVRYYQAVAGPLLTAMGGRPVLLQRFPHGAEGSSFFQKRVPDKRPDWLQTVE